MDHDTRMHVRRQRDTIVRKQLGLPSVRQRRKGNGQTRWTTESLKRAIEKFCRDTGIDYPPTMSQYRTARELLFDRASFPKAETVVLRLPEAFRA